MHSLVVPAPSRAPASHGFGRPGASRRGTIALLLDFMNFFSGGYEGQLRNTFDAKCRELDLDLFVVFGRAVDEPQASLRAHNQIFDLMRSDSFDAVIVVSTLLAAHCGAQGMSRFVERYKGKPLCSVGVELPGVPSILVDNRPGMEASLEHMLVHHGHRRIAFVAGTPMNPEAELRLQVYRDVLARHGIPYDPALVESGYFMNGAGCSAMEAILARCGRVDAVVAANDAMALGAIDALRRHGHRVPKEVPVTGFDDLTVARLGNPPHTTVAQPFEAIVDAAMQVVLEQCAGRAVPELTLLPTEFVVRESCGCNPRRESAHSVRTSAPGASAEETLRGQRLSLEHALSGLLRAGRLHGPEEAGELLAALERELAGEETAFLSAIEHILERTGDDIEAYRALQSAISFLRRELPRGSGNKLEDLWHDALAMITVASTTAQVQHRTALDENYLRLLLTSEQVSVAFDLVTLKDVLEKALPASGVRTVFVSRYADENRRELEPFVCLRDGVPVEPLVRRFPAEELLPAGARGGERRHTWLLFPLVFDAKSLGVAVFEYLGDGAGYHVLRDEIATALRNVDLHQEVVTKTMQHERSVQERLATAKRMQSLSVLAGGVAHDLNNALGPLVALPDIILRELSTREAASTECDIRDDLLSIKTASLRASQTIKDLLTLGRQGHTPREPLDLNAVVSSCLTPDALRFMANENPSAQVSVELWPEPLVIHASEAHVARAVTNLIKNAIEATGGGRVSVKTFGAHLAEPMSGYEAIDAGDYAVVTVSDDGSGIPANEMLRIFEPFFSKKSVGDRSGTGLGLAIVHGVVKEHAGFVDVSSAPGAGTTFTLYFPSSREPAVRQEPHAVAANGSATVLIVDDEPVQLRTARRILSHHGYRVDSLSSGREAFRLFERAKASGQSPYDLVILDMALNEEQDGYELFEQLHKLFPGQKAIVASGHAPTERVKLAVARGLDWLSKPYTADALVRAVQAALAKRPNLPFVKLSVRPSAPPRETAAG